MRAVPLELVADFDRIVRRILGHKLCERFRCIAFERHLLDLGVEILHRQVRVISEMGLNGGLHGLLGFQRTRRAASG